MAGKKRKKVSVADEKSSVVQLAQKCQDEVLAVLKRHGFQFKPRPVLRESSPGCWVTTAEIEMLPVS